ncbi:MAG: PQQ-binding-like beta-propeller repeat protein [Pseudomonadota bacterium]|nr:PQQ-binding-like beta-propeller repeat protein [Pseudomonadota bacterium]
MKGLFRATALGVTLMCLILFPGCGDWLEEKFQKKIPGKRIEVLRNSRALIADKRSESLAVVLPNPVINRNWPQPGGFPNHAMHHLSAPGPLSKLWSARIGNGSNDEAQLLAEPIVSEGRVYTIDINAVVSSLDANTGKKIWRVDLAKNMEHEGTLGGGIGIEGNRLYATTGFAEVISLDLRDGNEIWRTQVDGPIRAGPTVSEGRVFVVTMANQLVALSSVDGKELWAHTGLEEVAGLVGGASAAVDRGIVVVPFSSGEVVALRVDNGRLVWKQSLVALRRVDAISAISHVRGEPVIDKGVVFVVGNGKRTVAIDLRTGTRLWDLQIGGQNGPWVAGKFVYVLTRDAEVVCIVRDTGTVRWVTRLPKYKKPLRKKGAIFWSGPVLAGDRLLVAGTHKEVWSISPYSGEILSDKKISGPVLISPIVAIGTVYILTDDADLIAFR